MKPTLAQIGKFQKMLKKKLETHLLLYADGEHQQITAFQEHGNFLAQVGEENYEKVTKQISNKIALYNLAKDNMLNDSWDEKKISDSLKKAYAFKKTITLKDSCLLNNRNRKFYTLSSLMDEYIEDLENIKYIGDLENFTRGQLDFIPAEHFGKSAKKTKSPLKTLIKSIIQEYKITKHSPDSKILIDELY